MIMIINTKNMQIKSLTKTSEEAEILKNEAIESSKKEVKLWEERYNEFKTPLFDEYRKQAEEAVYKVMTEEEYDNALKEYYLTKPLKEVSEEIFEEMLNVLPPLMWVEEDGIEMFCISEMLDMTYTDQYAKDKRTGKCYTKIVDCTDSSTWINNFLEK